MNSSNLSIDSSIFSTYTIIISVYRILIVLFFSDLYDLNLFPCLFAQVNCAALNRCADCTYLCPFPGLKRKTFNICSLPMVIFVDNVFFILKSSYS